MKLSSHVGIIIAHFIGFFLVLCLSFSLMFGQLFRTSSGRSFLAQNLFSLSSWGRVFSYRAKNISDCTLPLFPTLHSNILGLASAQLVGQLSSDRLLIAYKHDKFWRIAVLDKGTDSLVTLIDQISYDGQRLSMSYGDIDKIIVYPTCKNSACELHMYSYLEKKEVLALPAIGGIPYPSLPEIFNLFFDEKNQIVSYTTNPQVGSDRIVLNWKGELLHLIDESPGLDRTLDFLGYIPNNDVLVYRDAMAGSVYFYRATEIGLYRNYRCSEKTN